MKMKPRVAVDMDETCVDLVGPWFKHLEAKTGVVRTRDDVDMYDCESVWKDYLSAKEIFDPFGRPGFWESLPPLDGAVEALKWLHDSNFNIFIVSNPWKSNVRCAGEKIRWIEHHLPFIGESKFILTPNKHLVNAHFFVDDHIDMIERCNGVRILIDRKWNKEHSYPPGWFRRVKDLTEAAAHIISHWG